MVPFGKDVVPSGKQDKSDCDQNETSPGKGHSVHCEAAPDVVHFGSRMAVARDC